MKYQHCKKIKQNLSKLALFMKVLKKVKLHKIRSKGHKNMLFFLM